MSDRRIDIVTTTIADGRFLDRLRPLLEVGGERVGLIVIGDLKTPPSCGDAVRRLAADGHRADWFGPEEQRAWLGDLPAVADLIPWNSDNRRNLGVLEAFRRGADVICSIDDDNAPDDARAYLELYGAVGGDITGPAIEADGRWINVCAALDCVSRHDDREVFVYPRGFPVSRRGRDATRIGGETTARVGMHLGLWLDEPDVDAATRSAVAPRGLRLKLDRPAIAQPRARSPVSTQNVAIARRLVPAWWYARMGQRLGGMAIDRFGDMLQSYFALVAMEAVGDRLAVGPPALAHERNPHLTLVDLARELPGMMLVEALLPLIESAPPPASDYAQAYARIAADLPLWARDERTALGASGLSPEDLDAFANETHDAMHVWLEACAALAPD